VPLNSIEYAYGFGVYETIRVSNSMIHFVEAHCQRLLDSASIIELEHPFDKETVQRYVEALVSKNEVVSCNVKIMLIGGAKPDLYIQCLNPLFPDRKLYKTGVKCITESLERPYPHAKTLNMLPSYLAYRRAQQHDAYDALLVNRNGEITEGTRTNFFGLKDRTIISPPAADILLGVARAELLKLVKQLKFKVVERPIPLASLTELDGCFLTSTSSRLMPIRTIDRQAWPEIDSNLHELVESFSGGQSRPARV
jgi:branched-chain amino acid aminotransferase